MTIQGKTAYRRFTHDSIVVTRRSPLTGKDNDMILPLSAGKWLNCWAEYHAGKLIQDAFPMLDKEQREFLITGCTPEDWKKIFPPGEEEY